jgi:hypothetical protein
VRLELDAVDVTLSPPGCPEDSYAGKWLLQRQQSRRPFSIGRIGRIGRDQSRLGGDQSRKNEAKTTVRMWEYGYAWGGNGHVYEDIADQGVALSVRHHAVGSRWLGLLWDTPRT